MPKHTLILVVVACALSVNSTRAAAQRVTGTWQSTTGIEFAPWTFTFGQHDAELWGAVRQNGGLTGPVAIRVATIHGDTITFKVDSPGGGRTITFSGRVVADSIVFDRATEDPQHTVGGPGVFGATGAMRFAAHRVDTIAPPRVFDPTASTVPGSQRWVASSGVATPWIFDLVFEKGKVTGEARQRAANAQGTLSMPYQIHDGRISGDTTDFTLVPPDSTRVVSFHGVRHGNVIDFTRSVKMLIAGLPSIGTGIVGGDGATHFSANLLSPDAPLPVASSDGAATTAAHPTANTGPARTTMYKGFKIDITDVTPSAASDSVIAAIRGQIDVVESVHLSAAALAYLRSVPLVMISGTGSAAYGNGRVGIPLHSTAPYDREHPILLHELCHAYHANKLPDGFRNADVLAMYDAAKAGGKFPAGSYMLKNPGEYFAMMASVFLYGSAAREPFARDSIKVKQPAMYEWLSKEFGAR